jgi:hypothetical protein
VLKQVVSLTRVGVRALADALEPEPVRRERRTEKFEREWVGKIESELRDLRATHEKILIGAEATMRDRDEWKRKAEEYHSMIEGIIGERDQWKKMWFDDSSGHLEAQAMLDGALETGRKLVLILLQHLNAIRKEHGLPPVTADLQGIEGAEKILEASKKRVLAQQETAPSDTDWAARAKAVQDVEPPATTDLKSPLAGPVNHGDLPDLP